MSLLSTLWLVILAALVAHSAMCILVRVARALAALLDNWIVRRDLNRFDKNRTI